jgi:aspartate kinase
MTINTIPNGNYAGSVDPKRPVSPGCVVQKYGGTSVGKFAWKIVTDVIKPSLAKEHVAVVCSAISAKVKADGTTNR